MIDINSIYKQMQIGNRSERSFTIRRIDDYEWALQLIGHMYDDSDENAKDSNEIDSVVDAAVVSDVSEFIGLLLAIVQETEN